MLAFIDESGDTGRKIHSGSSHYLMVALVVFEEGDEAAARDQRISLLRRELNYPEPLNSTSGKTPTGCE